MAFAFWTARPSMTITGNDLGSDSSAFHSDRNELEKALREALAARRRAEQELKDFLENAPIALRCIAADGTILWANRAELDLFGYSREEYTGTNIIDVHADRSAILEFLRRLSAGEELRDVETQVRAKDGSIKDVVISSNILFEEGRFIHTRCFTRDVTEKRKVDEELRTAESKFRRLFESNIIAIITRDPDGRVLEANDVYLRLVGYSREDFAAGRLRWTELTPPEYRDRDQAAQAEIRQRGECTPYEKEYIGKDGTRVPILLAAAQLSGGDTQLAYVIDLSERKLAERDAKFLAEASEMLSQTLDSHAVLQNLTRLFVPRFCDRVAVDLFEEDDTLELRAEDHHGGAMRIPLVARGATIGFIVFTRTRRESFTDRDYALAQEVARRAALAVDNARLYEAAQHANRAKDEFLATLSHELRTPMTAILGWSRFLRVGHVDHETMANAIDSIGRAAVAQAQLIDDVLDMSRIISGKLRLQMQEVELAGVVDAAVETVRPAIMAKGIQLEVDRDPSVGMVWGDPNRLQQAIWNLLTNSAKFTDSGGTITVSFKRIGNTTQIAVNDNGQGIDPDFLPHVFERFRQAESTSTRTYGGLGLGLAIVRYIVEMHGGRVTASSNGIGKGAKVTIELPIASLGHEAVGVS
ncbi:MAG TPA: PAS domain S-box protein [Thermoanaerobaculia bacterium]|nr:PAS domain S-box protein [Thermoanaerobaculia bacterium]